ncbi:MAG: RNA polymerase sigma factor [Myxococcota bacterium]
MSVEIMAPVPTFSPPHERSSFHQVPRPYASPLVIRSSEQKPPTQNRVVPLQPSKGPAESARENVRPKSPGLSLEKSTLAREVAPHRAMLRQVAYRILRCPEQAEDAVQEAMITLWERTDRPPELRGWLVRTVIHRSLHRRRSEGRRRRWEDEAAVAISVTCPICDPEEEFAQLEALEVVAAAVSSLAENQREVILLRSQGLDYEEIAETVGLPIGTVRSRLSRARRTLREQLDPIGL